MNVDQPFGWICSRLFGRANSFGSASYRPFLPGTLWQIFGGVPIAVAAVLVANALLAGHVATTTLGSVTMFAFGILGPVL